MRPDTAAEIANEVRLIQQFADSYRRKISSIIDNLNGDLRRVPDAQCVRLCVEAVDMMLMNQREMAKMLSRLSANEMPAPVGRAA